MRWKSYWNATEGDIRYKEKFLLFPKIINDEGRWLEKVKYKQEYSKHYFWNGREECYNYQWIDTEWVDK